MNLITHPNPILRQVSADVVAIDYATTLLVRAMRRTMYALNGIGLAAVQLGRAQRVLIVNHTGNPSLLHYEYVAINPVVVDQSEETELDEEGCLSIPFDRGTVRRAKRVTVRAIDLQGKRYTVTAEGLAARVWQHELDHLSGILFIDKEAK